jgi:hypothetical protein
MHFPVLTGNTAVLVENHRGIVIKPRRSFFKDGRDDDDAEFFSYVRQDFSGRAGNRLGKIIIIIILALAKIRPQMKLGQHYQIGIVSGGFMDFCDGKIKVGLSVFIAGLLDSANG